MRTLSATELLGVWERGARQTPPQRALELLAAAEPEVPLDKLLNLSIGLRDNLLLDLHTRLFGSHLSSVVNCSKCGDFLELNFNAAEIKPLQASREVPAEFSAKIHDYDLRFRVPVSRDLANLTTGLEVDALRRQLLENCLLGVLQNGRQISARELPEDVLALLEDRIAKTDPGADVRLPIRCPTCNRQWDVGFDIVSFLWSEIHAWASRLLREVHTLANNYGWSEADILSMHPNRRQRYLEMIGA
jgi:hypothetical protein